MPAGSVGYLVLDEADKMLSLGLQPQLDAIRAAVQQPAGKQAKPAARPRPQVRPWLSLQQNTHKRAAQSGGEAVHHAPAARKHAATATGSSY